MEPVIGVADGPDDGTDNEFQVFQITIFLGYDLFPVPLIHIDGVNIIQGFIPAYGVHICVQSIADGKIIALQSQTFPFSQRVDDLCIGTDCGNIEGYRTFETIQIVVQTGILHNKQGSRHAL